MAQPVTTLHLSLSTMTRLVQLPREVVVYADEQGTPTATGKDRFAVGMFYASSPIKEDMVTGAIARRRIGPGHRCLARPHFHASEDCTLCRDLLAQTLARDAADCFFTTLRWDFSRATAAHPERGDLHRHMTSLVLNRLRNGHGVQVLRLRYARCQGLSEQAWQKWFDQDHDYRLREMISRRGMPMAFPLVVAEETGPDEDGIQIADHLLWTERRQFARGGDVSLAKLGFIQTVMIDAGSPFEIRRYSYKDIAPAVVSPRPLGRDPSELTMDDVVNVLGNVERVVHDIARDPPAHVAHLKRFFEPTSRKASWQLRISDATLRALCRAFLVLVDTVPLYDGDNPDHVRFAADAARLAALIAEPREARAMSIGDYWHDIRAGIAGGPQAADLFGAS